MKYTKKPVTIEAIQWTGNNKEEIKNFCPKAYFTTIMTNGIYSQTVLYIETLEGTMQSIESDYIIKGVEGEFYPCKEKIFELTYEKI